jgi:hypothetical protein
MSRRSINEYQPIRKPRLERFLDWRRKRIRAFETWRKDAIGRFTQRGWSEAEAEVVSCHASRTVRLWAGEKYPAMTPTVGAWAVAFKYTANGKEYDGFSVSPVRVEKGDRFSLRYNPENPQENNTIDSETEPFNEGLFWVWDAFLLLVLLAFVAAGVFLKMKS